ncbi:MULTISPECIES: hypothetical protein [unclassified Rhizobium]|jgi:hypothetical protein|uniref:hypothetical protein n=1 Tax=unclassified Rhizobium TaxID=2613769 RepID=UPI000DD8002F|nr:hypothetical protein [Rhizobium sp. UBA1881]
MDTFVSFIQKIFPWFLKEPTFLGAIGLLYIVFKALNQTDLSFRAKALETEGGLPKLYRLHDNIYLFCFPVMLTVVTLAVGLKLSAPFTETIAAAITGGILAFILILMATTAGPSGSKRRLLVLAALFLIGLLIDLYLYGGIEFLLWLLVPASIIGLAGAILYRRISKVYQIYKNKQELILVLGALYNMAILGLILYMCALWFHASVQQ